ncbi:variant-specific surface protein [Plasmodium falciparum RAJ116]|uniref:Variant-specific surface protein n=1 Tax=Plasmodium falciparum RAJ116 TaxID=580058 RepID=A0A0L0CUC0_PLAFA|nr:variant-specific surface protein [Plasmodium falciparum RAJ116]
MVSQGGRQGDGGEDIDHRSAKHLLDSIGKIVHDQVKNSDAAKQYIEELKGNLQKAKGSDETVSTAVTCRLVEEYRSKANGDANSERHPCTNLKGNTNEERFSDTLGGQCTNEKMRSGGKGACAPYRRLHLCSHNLESINTTSMTTHKLLAEVCLAAKFEGESLKNYHAQYQTKYNDSQICTVLARSFADLGDIIRGKDLFYGNTQEKEQREQLDENLKKYFQQIHSEVTSDKNGELKTRYGSDKDPNYYQLREDWWTANRETVWKAMTCSDDLKDASYFRATCSMNGSGAQAKNKCTCINGDPPTYFDYVPQYLRWFEEWAEDFCRKRKHKLENAKEQCRGKTKGEKYCSGNGYDCKETVRGDEHFVEGECHDCSVACSPFVKWLDNQKLEFDKQKKKYKNEIEKYTNGESRGTGGSKRKKRGAGKSNYDGYESKFYKKMKEKNNYGTVDGFLELLNKEKTCTKNTDIEDGGKIDFKNVHSGKNSGGDGSNKTFYRTKYCEACPWCGAQKGEGGKWEAKNDDDCKPGNDYTKYKDTKIPILTGDKTKGNMVKKYKKFCANGKNGEKGEKGDQMEKWECYYDENKNNKYSSGAINFCVLQDDKVGTSQEKSMHYNAFFWKWVYHMLHDSIEWRNEHGNCINKKQQSKCIPACKKTCDCFQKWVEQKKTEWENVKKHFYKQNDIGSKGHNGASEMLGTGMNHDFVLNYLLKKDKLLQIIKETYGNADETEHIRKMLQETADGVVGGENNTTIDKLLNHELTDAKDCQSKHNCPPKPPEESPLRSLPSPPGTPDAGDDQDESEEEDDEDGDENDDDEDDGDTVHEVQVDEETAKEEEGTVAEAQPPAAPAGPPVNVCETVAEALTDQTNLTQACQQKYGGNNSRLGWKCIPSGDNTTTTGSICIPPRRRRLYIQKLHEWANSGNTQSSQPQTGGDKDTEARGSEAPSQSDKLRTAFIESAAVETFFLWHKFKAENTKRQGVGAGGLGGVGVAGGTPQAQQQFGLTDEPSQLGLLNSNLLGTGESIPLPNVTGVDNDNPQSKLQQTGEIPNDFLRQMFYTLGDYRDICVGNTPDGIDTNDKETMEKIEQKIKSVIENSVSKPAPRVPQTQHSVENPRVKWWNTHGPDIWNAMVCALTYKEDTSGAKGTDGKIEQDPKVKEAFFGTPNGNPGPLVKPTTQNGTFESKYQYNTVKLEEENSGPKTNEDTQPPTLKQFTSRPTYFRYLEEWGENFCKERKKRLEKIKVDCMEEDGTKQKYSGDGEECTQQVPKKDGTVPDLEGPSCAISCRSYKKWIQKKKIEFEEQSNAYKQQKQDAESNNAFSAILTKFNEAKDFLQKLGSCSKTNNNDNDNGDGKIEFHKPDETFRPAENCKPCSSFKINCKNGKCTGGTQNECNGKTDITANDIQTMEQPTEDIGILVSDNSGNEFNGLEACRGADIFKGIRNEQWKCGEYCGVDICEQTNVNGKKVGGSQNQKHIIQIRALFKRWLENFLKDYNKINDKISQCMKNREGSTCINQCENICGCVGIWINKKNEEWKNIKKRFFKQYDVAVSQEVYTVRSFLQQNPFHNEVHKAIKPCTDLDKFEESKYCAVDASSGKKDGEKSDVVECLLHRLKKEIESCSSPTSGESQPTDEQKKCVDSTPVEDDEEDLLLEEEEKNTDEAKKMMPKICEGVIKPEPVETEETCTPAAADGEQKPEEEAPTPEQNEVEKVKDKAPKSKPVTPAPQPTNPPTVFDNPQVQTALMTSTLAWSVGIGFVALSYWLLKKHRNIEFLKKRKREYRNIKIYKYTNIEIHYLNKKGKKDKSNNRNIKKTKRLVDLFSVIDIPKGEYGIPTSKSKNRYIPYASDRYKGKTYIYMEGDESDDYTYIGDISSSDITSSESEYEDIDINNIYPYKSPKYKTLIDVVLEPSKRDTFNTQSDIPSDTSTNKFTDNEWNQLKQDFISNILQSTQMDLPNENIIDDFMDKGIQPNNLILDVNMPEKPFITSIHDRDLHNGEEVTYNINFDVSKNINEITNTTDDSKYVSNNIYSGIDLINDSLNSDQHVDIYDELLKRKENEIFGTNHTKHTTTNSIAKQTHTDPILNQLDLFHKWLDRHRNMCEQWNKNKKEELLDKLKEEWNKKSNNNSDLTHTSSNIPSGENSIKNVLNTDVSIQIDMDDPKPINEFTNMDNIIDNLEKNSEPYYDIVEDDIIYFDIDDERTPMDHNNMDNNKSNVPTKVQIEMNVINKQELFQEEFPISDIWNI